MKTPKENKGGFTPRAQFAAKEDDKSKKAEKAKEKEEEGAKKEDKK